MMIFVARGGFEPPLMEPKSTVLPLDDQAIVVLICDAKIAGYFRYLQIFLQLFFEIFFNSLRIRELIFLVHRRRLNYCPAMLASSQRFVSIKLLKHRLQLGGKIRQIEIFFVNQVVAALTIPLQTV